MNTFRMVPLSQAVMVACSAIALSQPTHAGSSANVPLPTGQYVTPTAVPGAVQQPLSPGLPEYPNFVAGEAVRSALSPDGKTLAILCAGQNTLYKPDGSVDTANSTQYIFLYDIAGGSKQRPMLIQVIKQTNAHVGLAWSPDGNVLYATGGNDDAVYAYTKTGGTWGQSAKIALNHYAPGATESKDRNKGIGLGVQPNAGGLAISADGKTLVVANNYNDSISVIDTATNTVRYEHDLRPYFVNNEGTDGAAGGTYPFAVALKVKDALNNTERHHKGNGLLAYVSVNRDREVVVLDVSSPTEAQLVKRIKLDGNGLGMTLDKAQRMLYVAQDNADQVAVIDTSTNTLVDKIDTRAPENLLRDEERDHSRNHDRRNQPRRHTGASPIAVTLSPDGRTLYAVNDGANSIAVIPLKRGHGDSKVAGLIPTAYAPKDITFSADGRWMYIINGKSQTGPNPGHLAGSTSSHTSSTYVGGAIFDADGHPVAPVKTSQYPLGDGCDQACKDDNAAARLNARATNQYQFQLEKASLVSAPVPDERDLKALTRQVARNNYYDQGQDHRDARVMAFLRHKIKHVIYVVKENRTFDQVLGDLNNGSNGDPSLAVYGEAITPSHHALARKFVTLDNFMDPGDGSMDGWSWSMQGRVTSTEAITQQINYAGVNRGLSYESEGGNRNVPVNWKTVAERDAVAGPQGTTNYTASVTASNLPGGVNNLLAGDGNHASADAPFGRQMGYIFNAVLQAGGTVRNYGFLVNNFGAIKDSAGKGIADPYGAGVVQVGPLDPSLPRGDFAAANNDLPAGSTDVYFRGYDQNYPDLWRYNEWKREFDLYVANGKLPSLSLVRISHDHMGSFGTALAKVNTPETQQADTDIALGKMVEAVAKSPYANDTLFIITEDDCQDGPDHVDSHRATTYVVGPYVKKQAVVSTRYSQVNALRTIEDILGAPHINLNTAYQAPMTDVFDIKSSPDWEFDAVASTVLKTTELDLGEAMTYAKGPLVKPKHDAQYWAKKTAGFDFSDADRVPPARFNQILWEGLRSGKPYPKIRTQFVASSDTDD